MEFRRNTNGKIGRQDFLWTVKHVMGIDLAPQLVRCTLRAALRHCRELSDAGVVVFCAAAWFTLCLCPLCQVDMLFYLFADEGGALNVRYMYEVLNRHYTTGLNISYNFNKPPAQKSLLDCVRECTAKM